MKKFIMVSPYQPPDKLQSGIYKAVDNDKLQYDKPTAFPVIPLIHGYAEPGEEIEVIAVVCRYANATDNLKRFKDELEDLCKALSGGDRNKSDRFGGSLGLLLLLKVQHMVMRQAHIFDFDQSKTAEFPGFRKYDTGILGMDVKAYLLTFSDHDALFACGRKKTFQLLLSFTGI